MSTRIGVVRFWEGSVARSEVVWSTLGGGGAEVADMVRPEVHRGVELTHDALEVPARALQRMSHLVLFGVDSAARRALYHLSGAAALMVVSNVLLAAPAVWYPEGLATMAVRLCRRRSSTDFENSVLVVCTLRLKVGPFDQRCLVFSDGITYA